jgi:hypothetical protein
VSPAFVSIEGSHSGHLEGENNIIFLLWEIIFILMQKYFVVPVQQDGCENPLWILNPFQKIAMS